MRSDQSTPPAGRRPRGSKSWQPYRSRHRSLSHAEAHADDGQDIPPPPLIEHPLVPAEESGLIEDRDGLTALIEQLRGAGRFAYDAEFVGEHSYEPQFCVLQVATPQRIALVDATGDLDLTPFWELIVDPALEKLVHAGRQDLAPAATLLNASPRNIFDIQVAAAFAGLDYPAALPTLIEELTGADIGRGPKFSNWHHRPLSPMQLRYAANDVRYLPLIHHTLLAKLETAGNARLAASACAELSDMGLYRFDPGVQRDRIRGAGRLSTPQRAVLLALLGWRDSVAREIDAPPRTLLRDSVLLDLSRHPVTDAADFSRRRQIPKPIKQAHAQAVVELTRDAMENAEQRTGRPIGPPSDAVRNAVDRVTRRVRERCAARGVHSAVVTSKRQIGRLVRARADGRDTAGHPLETGWRAELIGDGLFDGVSLGDD